MHELGIVIEIFELLDEISEEKNLKVIKSVNIEAGELCGILPDYFRECWKAARLGGKYENTELRLDILPAFARCECGNEFEMMKCSRICPACKKSNYTIISGKEFNITQIEAT